MTMLPRLALGLACSLTLAACGADVTPSDAASIDAALRLDAIATMPDAPASDAPTPDAPSDGSRDCGSGRALVDRPDDSALPQIHVMYVLPSDIADRNRDLDGSIETTVASWSQWMSLRTGGTTLRLDTCGGALDVTFHRLEEDDASIAAHDLYTRDHLEATLEAAGFDAPNKIYAVYYEGASTFTCADAPHPPELVGQYSVVYFDGRRDLDAPCRAERLTTSVATSGYLEHSMLHEIFHTLGGAPSCAPSSTTGGHVDDSPMDLMYAGELRWMPTEIDVGRDDYWLHGRDGCLDLARSAFLDPPPAAAELPPGW